MSRRRTHGEAVRNRLITTRITEAQHAKLILQATEHGLTPSGLAEQLVTKGRVVVVRQGGAGMDPEVVHELKRLGNNLNQLAHAVNSGLPPVVHDAAAKLHGVATLLLQHHYFVALLADAKAREAANDSSATRAREEFQRHAELRSS